MIEDPDEVRSIRMLPVCWSAVSRDDARPYGNVIATGTACSGGGCIRCCGIERGEEQYPPHSTGSRRDEDSRRRAKEIALLTCLYLLEIGLLSLACLTGPAMGKRQYEKCSTQHTLSRGGEP